MVESQLMEDIVGRILNVCPAELIVLFGSYANGEQDKYSDLDLIVVTKRKTQQKRVARQVRASISRYGLKSDVLLRTKDELKSELAVKGSFLQSVYSRGKILYKKDTFSLQE